MNMQIYEMLANSNCTVVQMLFFAFNGLRVLRIAK